MPMGVVDNDKSDRTRLKFFRLNMAKSTGRYFNKEIEKMENQQPLLGLKRGK